MEATTPTTATRQILSGKAMPKDERDEIIASRKAAREAKKKAGGGKGGDGGKGKRPSQEDSQAGQLNEEGDHQVAKALTAREMDNDNDEEEFPMKG